MNVLFMSLGTFYDLNESSVHLDILKRFAKEHEVWLICKNEDKSTEMKDELGIHVLRVQTGKLKKVGIIKKGINTILVEPQFTKAIKSYLSGIKFDLVLYTTPPITFANAVKFVKKRDNAVTYLMLKDIFPQNAVDIGLMQNRGIKGLILKFFRNKEKQLYRLSDYIGCMSPANCEYIINNNPEVNREKVLLCPNTTVIKDMSCSEEERRTIRLKYDIPLDKIIFVYGGNLGKPQDIPFVIRCMKECEQIDQAFFLIVGMGTEYHLLEQYVNGSNQANLKLMNHMPKADYDKMIGACDVGMIFLDHRFTIPNFPSRLLSYMSAKIPVLAVTDPNTDVGEIIEEGGFGWWCESNSAPKFKGIVETIMRNNDTKAMGEIGFHYMQENYDVEVGYRAVMDAVNN